MKMRYVKRKNDYPYADQTECFQGFVETCWKGISGKVEADIREVGAVSDTYLDNFADCFNYEAERLNIILPVLKWCADIDIFPEDLEDELFLYHQDYEEGKLDGILWEGEGDAVIHDLLESYDKYFGGHPDRIPKDED